MEETTIAKALHDRFFDPEQCEGDCAFVDAIAEALRSYGEAMACAQREIDATHLERRASEIEAGQDKASIAAWMARIFRDEAAAIRSYRQ